MEKPPYVVEPIEVELWLKHKRLNDELQASEKAIEAYFYPLIQAALDKGDVDGARRISFRMPSDCIARVFVNDMIRQSQKKALS